MTRQGLIAVLVVGTVGQLGGLAFGLGFKEVLLISLLVAWAGFAYWVSRSEKRVIESFKSESTEHQQRILELLGWDAKPFLQKVRGTFRTDWRWAATNMLSMAALMVGLPAIYLAVTPPGLIWDRPALPWPLALVVGGLALWALLRRWRARTYRCPTCGASLSPIPNSRLQFECNRCGLLWYVLDQRKWV